MSEYISGAILVLILTLTPVGVCLLTYCVVRNVIDLWRGIYVPPKEITYENASRAEEIVRDKIKGLPGHSLVGTGIGCDFHGTYDVALRWYSNDPPPWWFANFPKSINCGGVMVSVDKRVVGPAELHDEG